MASGYSWTDLPEVVRDGVQKHFGPVSRTVAAEEGQSCDAALALYRNGSPPLFVKAVKGVSREMRWLRNEAEAGHLLDSIAPAVLFHEDIDEWLVVGFEHLTGRPADLAPASADLSIVAATLNRLAAITAPGMRPLSERWKPHWWEQIAEEQPDIAGGWDVRELTTWEERAAESVAGDRLIHTDLHEDQFVIGGDHQVHIIDWGWPASGAPWVDSAFMVIRLIHAGHSPAGAEAWARASTPWVSATDEAVTAFSVYVAGLWRYRATSEKLARTARDYAFWRLASS